MEPESPFDPPREESGEAEVLATADAAPKLGIIHLLVWMACTAGYLGADEMLNPWPVGVDRPLSDDVMSALDAMPVGAAIGMLLLLVARRRRGRPFPVHPGEFLGTLIGFVAVLDLAYSAIRLAFPESIHPVVTILSVYGWLLMAVYAMFGIWGICRIRQRAWQIFFGAIALLSCVQAYNLCVTPIWTAPPVSMAFYLFVCFATAFSAPPLLAATLFDFRADCRRPWTHWVGVVVQVWLWAIIFLAWWIF
jgi:hypothetical protein